MSVGRRCVSYRRGKNGARADTKGAAMNRRSLELTGAPLAGSVAAGVHAGLAPEHLREWPPLGASFVVAADVASVAVAALVLRPGATLPLRVLGVLLAALVAGYVSTRLAALPPLDPEREPFDRLGVATTAIEAIGLLLVLHLAAARDQMTAALPSRCVREVRSGRAAWGRRRR